LPILQGITTIPVLLPGNTAVLRSALLDWEFRAKIYGNWDFMVEANVPSNVDLDEATL